jgi:hypothetical protein
MFIHVYIHTQRSSYYETEGENEEEVEEMVGVSEEIVSVKKGKGGKAIKNSVEIKEIKEAEKVMEKAEVVFEEVGAVKKRKGGGKDNGKDIEEEQGMEIATSEEIITVKKEKGGGKAKVNTIKGIKNDGIEEVEENSNQGVY